MRNGSRGTFAGTLRGCSGRRTPGNQSVSGDGHSVAVYLHDFLRSVCRAGKREYFAASVWDASVCLPAAKGNRARSASGCHRWLSNRRKDGSDNETGRKAEQPAGRTAFDGCLWSESGFYGRCGMVCFRKREPGIGTVGLSTCRRRDNRHHSVQVLSARTDRMQRLSKRRTGTVCRRSRFSGARNGNYLWICRCIFGDWQLSEFTAGWNRTVDYRRDGSQCRVQCSKGTSFLSCAALCSRMLFTGRRVGLDAKRLFSAGKRDIDAAVFYQPTGTSAAQPVDYAGSRPDIQFFGMDGRRGILQFWDGSSVDWKRKSGFFGIFGRLLSDALARRAEGVL